MEEQKNGTPSFDRRSLMEQAGGDIELCKIILQVGLGEISTLVSEISSILIEKKEASLELYFHKLKGLSGSIGAMALYFFSNQIEQLFIEKQSYDPAKIERELNTLFNQLNSNIELRELTALN